MIDLIYNGAVGGESSEEMIDLVYKDTIIQGGGTSDYNNLTNKPSINNIELTGNKSLADLGIKQQYSANDIAFDDGQTFQQKYDSGQLKGDKGDKGETGAAGAKGEPGDAYTITDADYQAIAAQVEVDVDFSAYSTTEQVQSMIDTAIGGAINGSY